MAKYSSPEQKKNESLYSGGPVQLKKDPASLQTKTSEQQRNYFNAGSTNVMDKMEQSFNEDFSNVKFVENSDQAEKLQAKAFTNGNSVHFAPGQFQPHSKQGQELIGHELSHVVQQRGVSKDISKVNNSESLEKEADTIGAKAAAGEQLKGPLSQTQHSGIQKKDILDIDEALRWYKANPSMGYSATIALDLYKAAGTSAKAYYDQAVADGKTGESFVRLVAAAQHVIGVTEDGKCGNITRTELDEFRTGGKHGIDYAKLFSDKKLEIGLAVGDEFDREATDVITYLLGSGFAETKGTSKNTYKAKKTYKAPGDNTAPDVKIDVTVDITWAAKSDAKNTFGNFLANKEVAMYSGHARYGTGPDFDPKDKTDGNFVIGKGYDSHMNDILKKNPNDLKALSKAGKFDMNSYQVWMMNACSSKNYLDEVRKGHVTTADGKKNKSSANLRFFGSTKSVGTEALPMIRAVLEMKSMEEIIKIMNKEEGDVTKTGAFMAD